MKALLTGASVGIGRALAARSHAVTAVARGEANLRSLVAELGPGHDSLAVDLGTPDGLRKVAGHLAENPVNALVNNSLRHIEC